MLTLLQQRKTLLEVRQISVLVEFGTSNHHHSRTPSQKINDPEKQQYNRFLQPNKQKQYL